MAKDRRLRTPAQKAASAAARLARAATRRRRQLWTAAAPASEAAGYPLNTAITITWAALEGGDKRRGHILAMGEIEREKRLWSELRFVAARAGVEWIASRAPEHDRKHGLHIHLPMHLPDTGALSDALDVVERLTGAPAAWRDMRGRTLRGGGRTTHGVVAMSACGGWLFQKHVAAMGGSSIALASYAAKGSGKSKVEGQHRLSNGLSALARQWQKNSVTANRRPAGVDIANLAPPSYQTGASATSGPHIASQDIPRVRGC